MKLLAGLRRAEIWLQVGVRWGPQMRLQAGVRRAEIRLRAEMKMAGKGCKQGMRRGEMKLQAGVRREVVKLQAVVRKAKSVHRSKEG